MTLKRTKKKRPRLKRSKKKEFLFSTALDKPMECEACKIKARDRKMPYIPHLYKDEHGFIMCKCGRLAHFGTNEQLLKSKGGVTT